MDKRTKKLADQGVSKVMAYQKVFSGPDGTKVLNDLMAAHGMLSSTYHGNVKDMLIKEGERNVVLRILTMLKVNEKQLKERIEQYEREMAE